MYKVLKTTMKHNLHSPGDHEPMKSPSRDEILALLEKHKPVLQEKLGV